MNRKRIKLLGGEVDCLDKKALTSGFGDLFDEKTLSCVVKINSEFLLRSIENKEFSDLLKSSHLNIADGVGVLWSAKYLALPISKNKFVRFFQAYWQMIYTGASLVFFPKYCKSPIRQSFPGQDCFYLMLETAIKEKKSIYFFGGESRVLQIAIEKLKKKYPELKIAGFHDGFSDKGQGVIDDINRSKADLLFVGLGSPEQEYWIRDNAASLKTVKIAVGEGGTIDFIAGASFRAPKIVNFLGIEWLWRAFFSPNRTTGAGHRIKRVWRAVPVFIAEVVKYKIKNGQLEGGQIEKK